MELSIVIPAYNEATRIADTLEQIQEAMKEAFEESMKWELVLSDNNSSDQTAKIAMERGVKVVSELIPQISRARNTGASIAQGTFFLFLDADSYPGEGLFEEMKTYMRRDDVVGCGATIEVREGNMWNKLRMERLNPWMKFFKYSWGAFILCRREAFEAIGGFSEELYALEEIDFVRRLKRYGRKRGMKFRMLSHKLITSGRRDELHPKALFVLFVSNTLAVVFLLLHMMLPKGIRPKGNPRLFRFWYGRDR